MSEAPLVSVCMTSYCCEDFISEALESILIQEKPFSLEIVIVDDCSTDGTAEIIRSFRDKYPELVRAYYNESNLGLVLNNWKAFSLCRGKYIAILDADDYWTYPEKLIRQVEIMESRPDIVMTYHDGLIINEATGDERKFTKPLASHEYGIEGLLQNSDIWNSSVMYRNLHDNVTIPEWVKGMPYNQDYIRHVLHVRYGSIVYIDEVWGVYRLHLSNWSQIDIKKKNNIFMNNIYIAKNLKKEIAPAYRYLLDLQHSRHLATLAGINRHSLKFFYYFLYALIVMPWRNKKDIKDVLYMALKARFV